MAEKGGCRTREGRVDDEESGGTVPKVDSCDGFRERGPSGYGDNPGSGS